MDSKKINHIALLVYKYLLLWARRNSLGRKIISCLLIFVFSITNLCYGYEKSDLDHLRKVRAAETTLPVRTFGGMCSDPAVVRSKAADDASESEVDFKGQMMNLAKATGHYLYARAGISIRVVFKWMSDLFVGVCFGKDWRLLRDELERAPIVIPNSYMPKNVRGARIGRFFSVAAKRPEPYITKSRFRAFFEEIIEPIIFNKTRLAHLPLLRYISMGFWLERYTKKDQELLDRFRKEARGKDWGAVKRLIEEYKPKILEREKWRYNRTFRFPFSLFSIIAFPVIAMVLAFPIFLPVDQSIAGIAFCFIIFATHDFISPSERAVMLKYLQRGDYEMAALINGGIYRRFNAIVSEEYAESFLALWRYEEQAEYNLLGGYSGDYTDSETWLELYLCELLVDSLREIGEEHIEGVSLKVISPFEVIVKKGGRRLHVTTRFASHKIMAAAYKERIKSFLTAKKDDEKSAGKDVALSSVSDIGRSLCEAILPGGEISYKKGLVAAEDGDEGVEYEIVHRKELSADGMPELIYFRVGRLYFADVRDKDDIEPIELSGEDTVIFIHGLRDALRHHIFLDHTVAALALMIGGRKRIKDAVVLDMGTGTGILAAACLELGARRAIGIDCDASLGEGFADTLLANGNRADEFVFVQEDLLGIGDIKDILPDIADEISVVVANIGPFEQYKGANQRSMYLAAALPNIHTYFASGYVNGDKTGFAGHERLYPDADMRLLREKGFTIAQINTLSGFPGHKHAVAFVGIKDMQSGTAVMLPGVITSLLAFILPALAAWWQGVREFDLMGLNPFGMGAGNGQASGAQEKGCLKDVISTVCKRVDLGEITEIEASDIVVDALRSIRTNVPEEAINSAILTLRIANYFESNLELTMIIELLEKYAQSGRFELISEIQDVIDAAGQVQPVAESDRSARDKLERYLKGEFPSSEIIEVDLCEKGSAVLAAKIIREGKIAALVLRNLHFGSKIIFGDRLKEYELVHSRLIDVSRALSVAAGHDSVSMGFIHTVLSEVFFNSFGHGNKLNLDLPIFVLMETEIVKREKERFELISVYDTASEKISTPSQSAFAYKAGLGGDGEGIGVISSFCGYQKRTIWNADDTSIGTCVTISFRKIEDKSSGLSDMISFADTAFTNLLAFILPALAAWWQGVREFDLMGLNPFGMATGNDAQPAERIPFMKEAKDMTDEVNLPEGTRKARLRLHKDIIGELGEEDLRKIIDILTSNYETVDNKRSLLVDLEEPITRINGQELDFPVSTIQLKGIIFDAGKDLSFHTGLGGDGDTFSADKEGVIRRVPYEGMPDGGNYLKRAVNEFVKTADIYNDNHAREGLVAKYPIGWGEFLLDRPFLDKLGKGRRLGFVILGGERSLMDREGFHGMRTGAALAFLHRLGYVDYFMHPRNISFFREKAFIHDLDVMKNWRNAITKEEMLAYQFIDFYYAFVKLLKVDKELYGESKEFYIHSKGFLRGYLQDAKNGEALSDMTIEEITEILKVAISGGICSADDPFVKILKINMERAGLADWGLGYFHDTNGAGAAITSDTRDEDAPGSISWTSIDGIRGTAIEQCKAGNYSGLKVPWDLQVSDYQEFIKRAAAINEAIKYICANNDKFEDSVILAAIDTRIDIIKNYQAPLTKTGEDAIKNIESKCKGGFGSDVTNMLASLIEPPGEWFVPYFTRERDRNIVASSRIDILPTWGCSTQCDICDGATLIEVSSMPWQWIQALKSCGLSEINIFKGDILRDYYDIVYDKDAGDLINETVQLTKIFTSGFEPGSIGERAVNKLQPQSVAPTLSISPSAWMRRLGKERYLDAIVRVITKMGERSRDNGVEIRMYDIARDSDPDWLNIPKIADEIEKRLRGISPSFNVYYYTNMEISPEGRLTQLKEKGIVFDNPHGEHLWTSGKRFISIDVGKVLALPDGSVILGTLSRKNDNMRPYEPVPEYGPIARTPINCMHCAINCGRRGEILSGWGLTPSGGFKLDTLQPAALEDVSAGSLEGFISGRHYIIEIDDRNYFDTASLWWGGVKRLFKGNISGRIIPNGRGIGKDSFINIRCDEPGKRGTPIGESYVYINDIGKRKPSKEEFVKMLDAAFLASNIPKEDFLEELADGGSISRADFAYLIPLLDSICGLITEGKFASYEITEGVDDETKRYSIVIKIKLPPVEGRNAGSKIDEIIRMCLEELRAA